jgi:orotate phosphoribosyltransferase
MNREENIARLLLECGAIGINPQEPTVFSSGIVSPVYCDNSIAWGSPRTYNAIVQAWKEIIEEQSIEYNRITGVPSAGTVWAAFLSYETRGNVFLTRKQRKEHGAGGFYRGPYECGDKVLLVEDQVTSGESTTKTAENLRKTGLTVEDCLAVSTYEFREAQEAFARARVQLRTATRHSVIIDVAERERTMASDDLKIVKEWREDPQDWTRKYHLRQS